MRGPFLFVNGGKFTVKGVTYGTFAADAEGALFPARGRVRRDFAAMRAAHVNTVRVYTPPPDWLLEEARRAGLRVLVGIYWEGRNCNFDEPETLRRAVAEVRRVVQRCLHFPDVVLAYVIGNEIPPLVVRLYGWRVIRRFLRRLYRAAKAVDPLGLVTYGNYPSTEFLELEFLDFHTVNAYLLERATLAAYLARLMIQTKGKPLLLGEIGDDSLRGGQERQAEILDWTIPLALNHGACGVCVFGWTDDWVVGGYPVEDWSFGLVDRARIPKRALATVARRYGENPFAWRAGPWPRVSVVVCNFNGGATLDETLISLERLDYPDYEILYVDDGSTDDSLAIAHRHAQRVRILAHENRGLSAARNTGAQAATGELVAYIDSDAFVDPDWLRYLVLAMDAGAYSGAGGPNLTPESDGLTAQFIALCPGNPTFVLKDNVQAEHLAGVNMAFRRDALLALGGFDPVHRRAGDDVDICWRFEDASAALAFAPTAIVWHHRRPSIARYLKQQIGYGEAENQLERKHPDRFNLCGTIRWRGHVYVAYRRASALFRPFVYHGYLGTGLFQTLYQKEPTYLLDGPAMLQWYLVAAVLIALGPLSAWLALVGAAMLGASLWVAFVAASTAQVPMRLGFARTIDKVATLTLLYFLFPVARGYGRFMARLRHAGPLRRHARREWVAPRELLFEAASLFRRRKELRRFWGDACAERETILREILEALRRGAASASLGRDWENCDLRVNGSLSVEGRLYSSPDDFGRALCIGLRVYNTRLARWSLLFLAGACAWAALKDVRLLVLAPLCLLALVFVLDERARLRKRSWAAVERSLRARGARARGAPRSSSSARADAFDSLGLQRDSSP